MKFIPLRGKRPLLKKHVYYGPKTYIRNQTAIGIVNGVNGLTCLDIDHRDCEKFRSIIESIFPEYRFGLVQTHSGKYHFYFQYFGLKHSSVQFLETRDGQHFGELRCNRHQVFPSDDPRYTWSNQYKLIKGIDNLSSLTDEDIELLMNELNIVFSSKKSKCKIKPIGEEREDLNYSVTLSQWDPSLESYLPTGYDSNYRGMFNLLKVLYLTNRYLDCDCYFKQWLNLNRFKRSEHVDFYYWEMWSCVKKGFNPSKLRPFEAYTDSIAKYLAEAEALGLKSFQKQVTYAVEKFIPKIKDSLDLFHLGTHSLFFRENDIHPQAVHRALKTLIDGKKIKLVNKGVAHSNSRIANTYLVLPQEPTQSQTENSKETAPATSGSSQDEPGSVEIPEEENPTVTVGR